MIASESPPRTAGGLLGRVASRGGLPAAPADSTSGVGLRPAEHPVRVRQPSDPKDHSSDRRHSPASPPAPQGHPAPAVLAWVSWPPACAGPWPRGASAPRWPASSATWPAAGDRRRATALRVRVASASVAPSNPRCRSGDATAATAAEHIAEAILGRSGSGARCHGQRSRSARHGSRYRHRDGRRVGTAVRSAAASPGRGPWPVTAGALATDGDPEDTDGPRRRGAAFRCAAGHARPPGRPSGRRRSGGLRATADVVRSGRQHRPARFRGPGTRLRRAAGARGERQRRCVTMVVLGRPISQLRIRHTLHRNVCRIGDDRGLGDWLRLGSADHRGAGGRRLSDDRQQPRSGLPVPRRARVDRSLGRRSAAGVGDRQAVRAAAS